MTDKEVRETIVEAINELPELEKKILVLHYYEELPLEDIAAVLELDSPDSTYV